MTPVRKGSIFNDRMFGMLRTEHSFFDDHLSKVLGGLYARAEEIEAKPDLSDEDEMELAALDRLILALETL